MTEKHYPTVGEYLTEQLALCGKTQREVAEEVGFETPNVVTMLKQGQIKLPLNRVGPLARSLGVDAVYLLSLAMREYMPETFKAIEEAIQGVMLSEHEHAIVEAYRWISRGRDQDVRLEIGDAEATVKVWGATISYRPAAKAERTDAE